MKYLQLSIVAFLILGVMSCEKEFEKIKEIEEKPLPVDLEKRNLKGTVYDMEQNSVDKIKVSILVDQIELESVATSNGLFTFPEQPVHKNRTVISVTADNYCPNYASFSLKDNPDLEFDFVVTEYDEKQVFKAQEDINYLNYPKLIVEITADQFTSNLSQQTIFTKTLDFSIDDQRLLVSNQAIDESGNDLILNFDRAFYIGLSNDQGEPTQLRSEETYDIHFFRPENFDEPTIQMWKFDLDIARWVEAGYAFNDTDLYRFESDHFGYFAYTLPCTDNTPPVAIANQNITVSVGTTLIPADIDENSYDDCDTALTYKIKKNSDACGLGYDSYGDEINFCAEEIGTTVDVILQVEDNVGNINAAFTSVSIVE